jgi:hypothetical protein
LTSPYTTGGGAPYGIGGPEGSARAAPTRTVKRRIWKIASLHVGFDNKRYFASFIKYFHIFDYATEVTESSR